MRTRQAFKKPAASDGRKLERRRLGGPLDNIERSVSGEGVGRIVISVIFGLNERERDSLQGIGDSGEGAQIAATIGAIGVQEIVADHFADSFATQAASVAGMIEKSIVMMPRAVESACKPSQMIRAPHAAMKRAARAKAEARAISAKRIGRFLKWAPRRG